MEFFLNKTVRDDDELRASFDALAAATFGISFEQWWRDGFWTDRYRPYVLHDEKKRVAANVSINIMDMLFNGEPKSYIQLGTVMTSVEHRRKGLIRRLLDEVLAEWRSRCDGIYLFANDGVLDLYPRFGFARQREYRHVLSAPALTGTARRLDPAKRTDINLLEHCYRKGNPFSAFSMADNFELVMFHWGYALRDGVYHADALDAVIIAQREEDVLTCHDIFGGQGARFEEVVASLPGPPCSCVSLGFTPRNGQNSKVIPITGNDETLFTQGWNQPLFKEHHMMFPLLSHA